MNPLQNYMSSLQTKKTASPFTYTPPKGVSSLFAAPEKAASPFSTQSQKPQVAMVPNSPSAVSPATPTIAPATSTPTTSAAPAKNAYMDSLGANNGLSESQVRSNLDTYNTKTGSQQNGSTGTETAPTTNPKDAFLKSYRDYLSQYTTAIKPTGEEESAAKSLADIQSKIDERKLKGDQTYQQKLDQPGMLKAGAEEDAAAYARRENADLANLSVQQSGASRKLLALQGIRTGNTEALKQGAEAFKPLQIGDKYYDPSTGEEVGAKSGSEAGFTLSAGEVRYDKNGNQIASGGAKPMTAAQEAAAIKTQEQTVQAEQQATQSIGLINNLLAGDTGKITGIGQNPFNWGGVSNAKALNEYNQLQGLLKLGVRGLIKGQGAVSDYEGKILAQAASKLGRNLGNDDFKQALKDIRGSIKTNSGQVTSVTVTSPEGEPLTADLSGSEIYQLVSQGNTVIYN